MLLREEAKQYSSLKVSNYIMAFSFIGRRNLYYKYSLTWLIRYINISK
jgi:hypothetical protein